MSLFNDMLRSDQTIFKNDNALDYSFIPKIIPFREPQQRTIASCIKPMFQGHTGKNLFIYGQPGVGKTVACRHVFNELEEQTDDIIPLYINCWQKNTTHKVIMEVCELLGYRLTHNKKTEELVEIIKRMLAKKAAIFCFDEIDKVEDYDFLYILLEEIHHKAIFLITNYKFWLDDVEDRVKSRLMAEPIEFRPYNQAETKDILHERLSYAFYPGVWEDKALSAVAERTFRLQDIRLGLYLMKEAALIAEGRSLKKVLPEHTKEAIIKMDQFTIKRSTDLTQDERSILDQIKEKQEGRIGDLFRIYQKKGGTASYKTYQRKIKKLQANKFIDVEKTEGGKEGNTTIIRITQVKKLTDF